MTETERGALRAGVGRLAWLLRHTRPDLCFGVLQLQKAIETATVQNMLDYNRLVGQAHRDMDIEMNFVNLKIEKMEDLVILAWGDSSLMNVKEEELTEHGEALNTQAGFVIGVAHKGC